MKWWTSIDVSCGQCVKCTPSSLCRHFSSTHHFTALTQFVLPAVVLLLKPVYNFSKWAILKCATTTTTTILRPFFRDHPGELVPEENLWTLWCKGRLTEADNHPAGRHSIRTNQCPPPPSLHFLHAGCPSCNQPTVSKHCTQQWKKASNILTWILAAFLFSSHPKRGRDREAHLNYYA